MTAFEPSAYNDALIFLGTAGVLVPLVQRFRVSPILSFLIAGAILGPKGIGALSGVLPVLKWITISHREDVADIAELGVVFLMFLIGLETSLGRLMTMRRLVFGLGTLQVALSALLIGVFLLVLRRPGPEALVLALALALSSTAIVIEVLSRQRRLTTTTGRTSFAVLLLQDLAVVPVLLLVSILSVQKGGSLGMGLAQALVQGAVAVVLIILIGRLALRPLFRQVAATGNHELFVAATLFVAVAASLATAAVGLSMALGAFIAGLLLAETEFRRAIEATIDPFKGLLLGLFFFSVGMKLDLGALLGDPLRLIAATAGLIALKAALTIGLARLFRVSWSSSIETGLLLGPGGEFAFVVIGLAIAGDVVAPEAGSFTLVVVSLSMALIPACGRLGQSIRERIMLPQPADAEIRVEPPDDPEVRAIVVGHGRVGRLVSEMLERHGVAHITTDRDPVVVRNGRRAGRPVFFGDVRQEPFLRRCGIATVQAVVITSHTQPEIDEIVQTVRRLRQDVTIVSRARDAAHAVHLYDLGVSDAVPETIEASLQLSEAVLTDLGLAAGPVIASIHEKRDEFRRELRRAAGKDSGREPAVSRSEGAQDKRA